MIDASNNPDGDSDKPPPSVPVGAGVLSGKTLRSLMEEEIPARRLVVAPLLEPNEQLRDDQASVDIRLGSQFVLTQASAYGELDEYPVLDVFPKKDDSASLPNLRRLYQCTAPGFLDTSLSCGGPD